MYCILYQGPQHERNGPLTESLGGEKDTFRVTDRGESLVNMIHDHSLFVTIGVFSVTTDEGSTY